MANRQYCRLRAERVKEMAALLEEYGFDTVESHYTPLSEDCITGNTGFLTPDDLKEFDVAVDTYLNGKFYLCPVSAAEIVDRIDAVGNITLRIAHL